MKPILATRVRNQMKKHGNYEYYLKNININGAKTGCSGFIRNPVNNKIVYVTTEVPFQNDEIMYRSAESLKDYYGGFNQWSKIDDFSKNIAKALS